MVNLSARIRVLLAGATGLTGGCCSAWLIWISLLLMVLVLPFNAALA
jgi:hypothetical protein